MAITLNQTAIKIYLFFKYSIKNTLFAKKGKVIGRKSKEEKCTNTSIHLWLLRNRDGGKGKWGRENKMEAMDGLNMAPENFVDCFLRCLSFIFLGIYLEVNEKSYPLELYSFDSFTFRI